jgi:hypothetical protein
VRPRLVFRHGLEKQTPRDAKQDPGRSRHKRAGPFIYRPNGYRMVIFARPTILFRHFLTFCGGRRKRGLCRIQDS